jgi:AcrR family transcriptional regulator
MSISNDHHRSMKSRPYRMRRRASQVDETRLRITEAAVKLHTTKGPAHTSIASVAQEAGVTRLTVYRHFADADALFQACMTHWTMQNPRPDAAAWLAIPDLAERARRGFGELYTWYRAHADELYPLYRDTEAMPAAAQQARQARTQAAADALVGGHAGDDDAGRILRAVARHLVDFPTWRSLVLRPGLGDQEAVELAVRLLLASAVPTVASARPIRK